MKKTLFTAFAVFVFSGVSMANNQFDVKKAVSNSENEMLFFTDCETWAMDQMLLIDPDDQMSPGDAHDEYRYLVELCDSNGG